MKKDKTVNIGEVKNVDPSSLISEEQKLRRVEIRSLDSDSMIINKPGSAISAKLYAKYATKEGYIGRKEAEMILDEMPKEAVRDAKVCPGKHPNIDRLFHVINANEKLKIKLDYHPNPKLLGEEKSQVLLEVAKKFGTPVQVYFEEPMVKNIVELKNAFSWAPKGFKNFFAVKAAPNPFLLKIFKKHGMGADCSSDTELLLSEKVGITGENIMFTSNGTKYEEFELARKLGAIVNLDDITHIPVLEAHGGISKHDIACFRYNPGELKSGNSIVGNPKEAKYGLTKEQLFLAFKIMKEKGVTRFGLHTMVASNERNPAYFVDTARIMFETIKELSEKLDIKFEFVNLGGGIGIPYRSDQTKVDIKIVSDGIKEQYEKIIKANNLPDLKIYMECGRMITGPYGYLVSKVLHIANKFQNYVSLDATMANLMRPALYDAYHHITVLGKEHLLHNNLVNVAGSLCENNDQFAKDRLLPKVCVGDFVAIHDTGAHGHAMGFNYNGKKRAREVLVRSDGSFYEIRRPEEFENLTSTIPFDKLKKFNA